MANCDLSGLAVRPGGLIGGALGGAGLAQQQMRQQGLSNQSLNDAYTTMTGLLYFTDGADYQVQQFQPYSWGGCDIATKEKSKHFIDNLRDEVVGWSKNVLEGM